MLCLTLSVVYGIASLTLIPLVQEARRPGQSNFEVDARYFLFGRRTLRLKSVLMPQYVLLLLWHRLLHCRHDRLIIRARFSAQNRSAGLRRISNALMTSPTMA